MGEDSYRNACDRKSEHSLSTMSTCSEADSESTCPGSDITPDEDIEQELEYGPGIVSRLKTRFLTITLKQNRGASCMRRSCSLENILEQKTTFPDNSSHSQKTFSNGECYEKEQHFGPWSNLKRAKSMDTLLMSIEDKPERDLLEKWNNSTPENADTESKAHREPKVIKRKDGPLNRSTVVINDEEFPKPDTVKTYKRMFEPAESKRGSLNSNVRRKPPVLRASAKVISSSTVKVSSQSSVKVNGVAPLSSVKNDVKTTSSREKSKYSAKTLNSASKKPGDKSSTINGSKFNVITEEEDQIQKDIQNLNLKNVANEVHFPGTNNIICNGVNDEKICDNDKKEELPFARNVRVAKYLEGTKLKPKIPPNRPVLQKPRTTYHKESNKIEDLKTQQPIKNVSKCNTSLNNSKEKFSKSIANGFQNGNGSNVNGEVKNELKVIPQNEKQSNLKPVNKNKFRAEPIANNLSDEISKKKEINGTNVLIEKREPNPVANGLKLSDKKESNLPNGFTTIEPEGTKKDKLPECKDIKSDMPVKDTNSGTANGNPQPKKGISSGATTMVFDFRGKDVISHLAVMPTPFGCKSMHPKKRTVLIDGKESVPDANGFINGDGEEEEEEDEDYIDYSTPPPSGVVFEGENVRVGKGAILVTRNKDLKIQFHEDPGNSTFVYPSESSLLEDGDPPPCEESSCSDTPALPNTVKLLSNTVLGNSGVSDLSTYTPSVLRTVDNFEPGMFRLPPAPVLPSKDEKKTCRKKGDRTNEGKEEEENKRESIDEGGEEDDEMLKPADPEFISSWSLSTTTSDLLF